MPGTKVSVIDGFRLKSRLVAEFRFGHPSDSYVLEWAKRADGGVIGSCRSRQRQRISRGGGVRGPRRPSIDLAPRGFRMSFGRGGGLATGKSDDVCAGSPGQSSWKGRGRRGGPPERSGWARMEPEGTRTGGSRSGPGLGARVWRENALTFAGVSASSSMRSAQITIARRGGVRYADWGGPGAMGIDLDLRGGGQREADRRENAQPFRDSFCTPPREWLSSCLHGKVPGPVAAIAIFYSAQGLCWGHD